jgi:hypothetical protein
MPCMPRRGQSRNTSDAACKTRRSKSMPLSSTGACPLATLHPNPHLTLPVSRFASCSATLATRSARPFGCCVLTITSKPSTFACSVLTLHPQALLAVCSLASRVPSSTPHGAHSDAVQGLINLVTVTLILLVLQVACLYCTVIQHYVLSLQHETPRVLPLSLSGLLSLHA